MTDYIDREAALAVLEERYRLRTHCRDFASAQQLKLAKWEIGDIPAADVRPVVRGKWLNLTLIPDDMTGHTYGECSICGKVRIIDNFCPNCGARMEE